MFSLDFAQLKQIGTSWPIAKTALMTLLLSSNLSPNLIRRIKNQVRPFRIIIIKLLLYGNNCLLQLHLSSVLRTLLCLQNIVTGASLCTYDGYSRWRSLAPSLDAAVKELIFEENPWPTHHISYSDCVLVTPSSPLYQPIDAFTTPPWTNFGSSIPLSPQRVLATSSIMPKAMISLSTKNFRNSFKSKINVIFLGQPLYVPQIHMCLQVHLRLPRLQVIAVDIEVVFR